MATGMKMDKRINEKLNNRKQETMITPEIRYKKTEKGMLITEYSGDGQLRGPAG